MCPNKFLLQLIKLYNIKLKFCLCFPFPRPNSIDFVAQTILWTAWLSNKPTQLAYYAAFKFITLIPKILQSSRTNMLHQF